MGLCDSLSNVTIVTSLIDGSSPHSSNLAICYIYLLLESIIQSLSSLPPSLPIYIYIYSVYIFVESRELPGHSTYVCKKSTPGSILFQVHIPPATVPRSEICYSLKELFSK